MNIIFYVKYLDISLWSIRVNQSIHFLWGYQMCINNKLCWIFFRKTLYTKIYIYLILNLAGDKKKELNFLKKELKINRHWLNCCVLYIIKFKRCHFCHDLKRKSRKFLTFYMLNAINLYTKTKLREESIQEKT